MSLARVGANRTGGFSLVEVLVALAVATVLVGTLTRFVSTTRLNAAQIRQQLAVDTLSETLTVRSPQYEWQPGRTDGRTGTLNWRIDVEPIGFYARALRMKEKDKKEAPASPHVTGGFGLSDAKNEVKAQQVPVVRWVSYLVTVIVRTPLGGRHEAYTIRLGRPQVDKTTDQKG